jgi:hypothetical protein
MAAKNMANREPFLAWEQDGNPVDWNGKHVKKHLTNTIPVSNDYPFGGEIPQQE